MMEDLRQKIERLKILCEDLDKQEKSIFIKFFEGNLERWSSAEIFNIGDINLYLKPFKGHGVGKKIDILWANIIEIKEFINKK